MGFVICKACRSAADAEQFGLEAHAEAGCKEAQYQLDHALTSPGEPYTLVLLSPAEHNHTTFCDCQHRSDVQPNILRVDPSMKGEILERNRPSQA